MAEPSQSTNATARARSDAGADRVIFLVEVQGVSDALARVLCPFAVLQVELALVELRRTGNGANIRLETEGLSDHWAQVLARRLEQIPTVLSVGLGWRLGTDAHGVRGDGSAFPDAGDASS